MLHLWFGGVCVSYFYLSLGADDIFADISPVTALVSPQKSDDTTCSSSTLLVLHPFSMISCE